MLSPPDIFPASLATDDPFALDASLPTDRAAGVTPVVPVEMATVVNREELSPWRVHVRLETSLTYDDNIFIQPSRKQSDFYFGISPLMAAGWGQFRADPTTVTGETSRFPQVAARNAGGNALLIRYVPTARFFVRRDDENTVDHDVALGGRWAGQKLAVDAAARFQRATAPDIDVGNRITSTVVGASINANYQATGKTSVDARAAFEHRAYDGGVDSTDASFGALLNYQVLPKTMIGIGGSFGSTDVEGSGIQYYEQGLFHLRYEPTFKLSFEGTVGVEFRQFENGPNRTSPVAELAAEYTPQEATAWRLSVSHRVEASAIYSDQDTERTSIEGSIRQRFFQRMYLTLLGGYQTISYIGQETSANRDDDYFHVGVESAAEITKWLSIKASYRHQVNESSLREFGFERNVADFRVSVQF